MPEHYTKLTDDIAGDAKSDHPVSGKANGATPYTGTPEWRIADRGTPDTIVTRTRKGRATYEVTSGHVRYTVGADPFRTDDVDCLTLSTGETVTMGRTNLYRIDHVTLAQMADTWIALNDPDIDRPCTCDDLHHTVLVLRKGNRQPTWDTDAQRYVTAERVVRRCHCRPFPHLMGLDGGRRNSWHEQTPEVSSVGYRAAQGRVERSHRVSTLRRRANDPGVPVFASDATPEATPLYWAVIDGNVQRIVSAHSDRELVCVGHDIRPRGKSVRSYNVRRAVKRASTRAARPWAREATVIAKHMAGDAPEVTVTDFPGVTITIRRNAGTRWAVNMVRGSETISFRARTVDAIARRVIA